MILLDVGKFVLIAAAPTLLGATALSMPRIVAAVRERWPDRAESKPCPTGPPIQQLAADLRRLLRLHDELTSSAHIAMRAHRLWAVEAAIGVRAMEAARALDVPHRDPELPGALSRRELTELLRALSTAGLTLPTRVGPFTRGGRI